MAFPLQGEANTRVWLNSKLNSLGRRGSASEEAGEQSWTNVRNGTDPAPPSTADQVLPVKSHHLCAPPAPPQGCGGGGAFLGPSYSEAEASWLWHPCPENAALKVLATSWGPGWAGTAQGQGGPVPARGAPGSHGGRRAKPSPGSVCSSFGAGSGGRGAGSCQLFQFNQPFNETVRA